MNDDDGTGIGLAITKSIADFHKIDVSVSSEVEKGTTFSFIFPAIS
jgi:signal transduction histidine kinase